MSSDGRNIKATIAATTVRQLKAARQILWAVLGLKMALDRLTALKIPVVAETQEGNAATIKVEFGKLGVDFDSGTINGKDMYDAIEVLSAKIKEHEDDKEE